MKSVKKIISVVVAFALIAAMAVCTMSASAAKDSLAGYSEFKGSLAVISNCDQNDASQKGKIDPFGGAAGTTSAEIEGTATTAGKASGDVSYSTEHYLQGNSSVKIKVATDQTLAAGTATGLFVTKSRFVIRQIPGLTVANPANTYLSFYMYCESTDDLKQINWGASAIEISETQDSKEYQFSFNQIQQYNVNGNFKAGWNKIELPLSKANATPMQIKMFRLFLFSNGNKEVNVYVDNIALEIKKDVSSASSAASVVGVPSGSNSSAVSSATSAITGSTDGLDNASVVTESTAQTESVASTAVENNESKDNGFPIWAIILIAVVVLAGAGCAVYFLVIKKKK